MGKNCLSKNPFPRSWIQLLTPNNLGGIGRGIWSPDIRRG